MGVVIVVEADLILADMNNVDVADARGGLAI